MESFEKLMLSAYKIVAQIVYWEKSRISLKVLARNQGLAYQRVPYVVRLP